jgi:hypothetical protein
MVISLSLGLHNIKHIPVILGIPAVKIHLRLFLSENGPGLAIVLIFSAQSRQLGFDGAVIIVPPGAGWEGKMPQKAESGSKDARYVSLNIGRRGRRLSTR